jgi:hypothetical protein
LATSTPAYSPYTQTNYAPYSQPTNNLEARLQQQVQAFANAASALNVEAEQAYQVINNLIPFMAIAPIQQEYILELERTLGMLVPFVQAANIWAGDINAYQQTLDSICYVMSDPEYLVYWAFLTWNRAIQPDGGGALEWISDEFMKLLDTYEARYMQASGGQHSPAWHRRQSKTVNPVMGSPDTQSFAYQQPQFNFQPPQFQQQQIPPMPPVPGTGGQANGSLDALKQRIAMMKSGVPDLAQQMQRAHVQQRQMMGLN